MRIAIDARMMGAGKTRGIGRYIEEIVNAMQALSSDVEFVLLQPNIPWYTFSEQLKMPGVFRRAKADVVWVPHWNVPLLYRGPLAITIHDLLLLHQASSAKASTRSPIFAWIKRAGYRLVLWNAIRRASIIFVPAHAVEKDVIEHFPFAKNKILVTGEGVSELVTSNVSGYRLPPTCLAGRQADYLLYFGSAYPHKRLDILLQAWSRLSSRHPELSLVIAGEKDVFMKRVMDEVARLNLPRVHFPGRLSDAELAALLSGAAAHVHPSSFEGFALPSLEALSLGCPTVVADIPVFIELLPKDGVFFFKNGDADDMIRTIEMVLKDREAGRALARRGGEEARRRYDWNVVAERTLAAIRSVAHVR